MAKYIYIRNTMYMKTHPNILESKITMFDPCNRVTFPYNSGKQKYDSCQKLKRSNMVSVINTTKQCINMLLGGAIHRWLYVWQFSFLLRSLRQDPKIIFSEKYNHWVERRKESCQLQLEKYIMMTRKKILLLFSPQRENIFWLFK